MDPNACLKRMDEAIAEGDLEDADYATEDLWLWLRNKGFPPDGLSHDSTIVLVREASKAIKECGGEPSVVLDRWAIAKDVAGINFGDEQTPSRGL